MVSFGHQYEAGSGQASGAGQVGAANEVAAINQPADAAPYQPNCNAPQDRDEADLCAQRQMADAASQLTDKTNVQLWLVGGEILVLIAAFVAAVRAAIAARDAAAQGSRQADAAIEANRINTAALNAAQRPWIDVDVAITKIVASDDEIKVYAVIQMRNVGNAPAMSAFVHPKVIPFGIYTPQEMDAMVESAGNTEPNRRTIGYTIFPGRQLSQPYEVGLRRENVDDFVKAYDIYPDAAKWLVPGLIGYVDYESPTDRRFHLTGFSVSISKDGGKAIQFGDGEIAGGRLKASISFQSVYVD